MPDLATRTTERLVPALDHRSRMGVATRFLSLSLSLSLSFSLSFSLSRGPHLYLTLASLDIRLSSTARPLLLALQQRCPHSHLLFSSLLLTGSLFFYSFHPASWTRVRSAGASLLSPMSQRPSLIDKFGCSLRKCVQ